MEEILFQHNLCLLNEGNNPTFETSRAAICIDITVASSALASLVTQWKVQTEMHLSDHHLITAQLDVIPDMMPLPSGRHLKKADWKTFSSLITTTYARYEKPLLWTASTFDKATAFLHSAIEAALDEVAPIKPKKAIFSWYTDALEATRKKCRQAHEYARRQPHKVDDGTHTKNSVKTTRKHASRHARSVGAHLQQIRSPTHRRPD
jgi:hypothetical protein